MLVILPWSLNSSKWGPCCRWLGTFESAEEAAVVYDLRKRQIKGENAKCNFPPLDLGGKLGERAARQFSASVGVRDYQCIVPRYGL